MPSRYLNRRRFEVAADGHTGNCGRVAVFNGCNVALGQTGTVGHKQTDAGITNRGHSQPICPIAVIYLGRTTVFLLSPASC